MWTRAELKREARAVLKNCYWTSLLVTVIASILGGAGGGSAAGSAGGGSAAGSLAAINEESFAALIIAIVFFLVVALLISLAMLLISAPIAIGERRYFLEATQQRYSLNNILYGFTCGRYKNVVLVAFLQGLYISLWTMLFIIPGVIKTYAYSMTNFIMAENPNIPASKAIDLSCRMTKGNKWKIFVFSLSFLGWYFLGALAFGIGTMFVNPYVRASEAQLYLALRADALDKGVISLQELEFGLH